MKIGFFITARLKSSRLKQKILLDLAGSSVLDHVIRRCKAVAGIDGVVLCTSTNPQDSILYDYALKHNIQFYPGSEDDVLERLSKAAEYYGYDSFLSITADNPLFSIYLAQIALDWFKREPLDFIFIKGLPIGCSPYLLAASPLKIADYIQQSSDTEIWGPFVNRDDFFSIGDLCVTNSSFKENRRLTIDYPQDYELIRRIYNSMPTDLPRIQDVFQLMLHHHQWWKINDMHQQRRVPPAQLEEIDRQFQAQRQAGLDYAQTLGIPLKPGRKTLEVQI